MRKTSASSASASTPTRHSPASRRLFRSHSRASQLPRYQVSAADYLLPRWRGKRGEWEAYAERERQRLGAGAAGDALYARIGWAMKHRYRNMFRETAINWDTMASGFQYLIKQHPQSDYLKNAYAYFCWKAADSARLREALPPIRANPDMQIWVNLENVALAEKLSKKSAGP